jgi:hypothetical protein
MRYAASRKETPSHDVDFGRVKCITKHREASRKLRTLSCPRSLKKSNQWLRVVCASGRSSSPTKHDVVFPVAQATHVLPLARPVALLCSQWRRRGSRFRSAMFPLIHRQRHMSSVIPSSPRDSGGDNVKERNACDEYYTNSDVLDLDAANDPFKSTEAPILNYDDLATAIYQTPSLVKCSLRPRT